MEAGPSLQIIWSKQNGLNELKKKTAATTTTIESWMGSTEVGLGKVEEVEVNEYDQNTLHDILK